MRNRVTGWRFGGGKGGCRWCACGEAVLLGLLCRGRRRCLGGIGCLAAIVPLSGLGWIAWVYLRHRERERARLDYPGEPDPGKPPHPSVQHVPPEIYRRPDPMIYSQTYLLSQGIAVTWDNPDVQLEKEIEKENVPVASHELEPATEYDIVARIWNASPDAPAVALPVRFTYSGFGIGIANELIGEQSVDLAVKGAPGCPAFARVPWTTPSQAGHYCIQVELLWADDANPENNLGQENTDVRSLNSPRAAFLVPVRNDGRQRRSIQLTVDSYRLGEPQPCPPEGESGEGERERAARRRRERAWHADGAHPVPDGWTVALEPRDLELSPGETAEVNVEVTAPDGFEGRQSFNLNALANDELIGGVTLIAEGRA